MLPAQTSSGGLMDASVVSFLILLANQPAGRSHLLERDSVAPRRDAL
jgi:hypothetical protein